MSAVVSFVLSKFPGVEDIADVNPYAGFVEPKVKEITITKTLKGQGFLGITSKDDNTLVSARTILIRYTKNPNKSQPVYVKRAFSHPAAREEDEESDRMIVAMDGIARAVLIIPPNDDSAKSVFVMKEAPNCMYLQAPFVRTCMLIDAERNLMNGIIELPPNCPELPSEAVIFDEQKQSVSFPVDHYYLVPDRHILSWCLYVSDHWRRMRGIFALEMDVTPKDGKKSFILYFAVADKCFERIKAACIKNFLQDKVDRRPLSSIGLETTGYAEVSATFSYMVYPTNVDVAKIAPVLDTHFVPYAQVLQTEVEEIRAREALEEEMRKKIAQ